jgi:hypothetical protein
MKPENKQTNKELLLQLIKKLESGELRICCENTPKNSVYDLILETDIEGMCRGIAIGKIKIEQDENHGG